MWGTGPGGGGGTDCKGKILHHAAHAAHVGGVGGVALAGEQVLYAAVGVDLHGAEVVEALDEARLLAELLAKGVAEVVGGVGRDEQHGAAHLGQLDGQTARRRRLADAALAADKDPPQRPLVEDGLERGLHGVGVVGVDEGGGGHGCCGFEGAERGRVVEGGVVAKW